MIISTRGDKNSTLNLFSFDHGIENADVSRFGSLSQRQRKSSTGSGKTMLKTATFPLRFYGKTHVLGRMYSQESGGLTSENNFYIISTIPQFF